MTINLKKITITTAAINGATIHNNLFYRLLLRVFTIRQICHFILLVHKKSFRQNKLRTIEVIIVNASCMHAYMLFLCRTGPSLGVKLLRKLVQLLEISCWQGMQVSKMRFITCIALRNLSWLIPADLVLSVIYTIIPYQMISITSSSADVWYKYVFLICLFDHSVNRFIYLFTVLLKWCDCADLTGMLMVRCVSGTWIYLRQLTFCTVWTLQVSLSLIQMSRRQQVHQ